MVQPPPVKLEGLGTRFPLRSDRPARAARQRAPRGVWVLVACMAVVLAPAWTLAILHVGRLPHYPSLPWPFVAAAVAAASLASVTIPFRGASFSFSPLDIPLIVGAVYLSPLALLLAVAVGYVAARLVSRRPPSRVAFNALNYIGGALAALVVYRAVVDVASPASMRGWAAAALALLAAETAMTIGLAAVQTVNAGHIPWRAISSSLQTTAAAFPLWLVLILVANCLTWVSRPADLLFVGLAAIAGLVQRSTTDLRHRYDNLQRLYRFTERTSRVTSNVEEVVAYLLRHARDVLGAESAEFVHFLPEGRTSYTLVGGGELMAKSDVEISQLVRLVVESRTGLLAIRDDHRPEVVSALVESGCRDAIGAFAPLGRGSGGVLLVTDRDGPTTFDAEDLRLLEVLAAHSAVVIRGGTLFEELQEEAAARRHEALHDGLTGLANRTRFNLALADALVERPAEGLVAVMLIDLDGFKEINDTLGHHVGDVVLQQVASRLEAIVGDHGTAARLGGDEFAVVITGLRTNEDVSEQIAVAQDRLSLPMVVEGLSLGVRASLGVSIAPLHGQDRTDLLRHADMAMYAAKLGDVGAEVYDPGSHRRNLRRINLATELGPALAEGELEVWFQPQADLLTGRIVGFEALLRWRHPTYGELMPAEFIPLAEQSGTIGALTWLVLERSIEQVNRWSSLNPDIGVAVNMAARTLLEADLVERIVSLLDRYQVEPSRLTLELTESSLWSDEARSGRVLALLREHGVSIALDDFGTGHSSLTRLKRLPVDVVKIDKSFVASMTVDAGDMAIVRSTVELARDLRLTVVAEGVEDQVTWDRLAAMGCHRAQGFYLAAAMRPGAAWDWLSRHEAATLTGTSRSDPL